MRKGTFQVSTVLLLALSVLAPSVFASSYMEVPFSEGTSLAGTKIPKGLYTLRCKEASSGKVAVTIAFHGKVVATAEGRTVELPKKADGDSVVYKTAPDGGMAIHEIRFVGKAQAIRIGAD